MPPQDFQFPSSVVSVLLYFPAVERIEQQLKIIITHSIQEQEQFSPKKAARFCSIRLAMRILLVYRIANCFSSKNIKVHFHFNFNHWRYLGLNVKWWLECIKNKPNGGLNVFFILEAYFCIAFYKLNPCKEGIFQAFTHPFDTTSSSATKWGV